MSNNKPQKVKPWTKAEIVHLLNLKARCLEMQWYKEAEMLKDLEQKIRSDHSQRVKDHLNQIEYDAAFELAKRDNGGRHRP